MAANEAGKLGKISIHIPRVVPRPPQPQSPGLSEALDSRERGRGGARGRGKRGLEGLKKIPLLSSLLAAEKEPLPPGGVSGKEKRIISNVVYLGSKLHNSRRACSGRKIVRGNVLPKRKSLN